MSCPFNKNIDCPCTYHCPRHGKCCECIVHHRDAKSFPACYFSTENEARYDRSFEALKRDWGAK
ncbi:MAG: hypothetical protein LBL66_02920 [Clostridiales bacterium]|nr:hypothetical protein [Clostridiales bacterium]